MACCFQELESRNNMCHVTLSNNKINNKLLIFFMVLSTNNFMKQNSSQTNNPSNLQMNIYFYQFIFI